MIPSHKAREDEDGTYREGIVVFDLSFSQNTEEVVELENF
jgi:hypothetical protein